MSLWARIYRNETRIDFIGNRNKGFLVSGILLAIGLSALGLRQLNLGVDFVGGTVVESANPNSASTGEVRDALRRLGLEAATIQLTGQGGTGIRVQTEPLKPALERALVEAVAEVAGVETDQANVASVGATFGREVARRALRALIAFLVAVTAFIALRFDWRMALVALVALIHDLILSAGVYAVTGFEVTPATVIAILTILGYSLYDTVVVYDKLDENQKSMGRRRDYSEVVNVSMNQVLVRSINTSLTTLLPIASLLFVGSFLLGATTLREFALALLVGVAAGTYSSIVIAAPLLSLWKQEPEVLAEVPASPPRSATSGPRKGGPRSNSGGRGPGGRRR